MEITSFVNDWLTFRFIAGLLLFRQLKRVLSSFLLQVVDINLYAIS